jgi:hypothetical protein
VRSGSQALTVVRLSHSPSKAVNQSMPDVGGGCVSNATRHSLGDISLRWMVREVAAAQCGIKFDDSALQRQNIPHSIFPAASGLFAKQREAFGRWSGETERSGVSIISELDEEDLQTPIHDQLAIDKRWWFLELIPTNHSWQDGRGVWHNKWGCVSCSLTTTLVVVTYAYGAEFIWVAGDTSRTLSLRFMNRCGSA